MRGVCVCALGKCGGWAVRRWWWLSARARMYVCVRVCVRYQQIAAIRIHEEATDDRNLGECVCVRKSERDAGTGDMRI